MYRSAVARKGPPPGATCESCGDADEALEPVRRVYLEPDERREPAASPPATMPEVERWCRGRAGPVPPRAGGRRPTELTWPPVDLCHRLPRPFRLRRRPRGRSGARSSTASGSRRGGRGCGSSASRGPASWPGRCSTVSCPPGALHDAHPGGPRGLEPARRVDATVHGDLEGEARLVFTPSATGTIAEVSWTIEMMQRPMRLAARVAGPLLRWGHDRVVEATVAGFRRHAGITSDGPGPVRPPAPPRPTTWRRRARSSGASTVRIVHGPHRPVGHRQGALHGSHADGAACRAGVLKARCAHDRAKAAAATSTGARRRVADWAT